MPPLCITTSYTADFREIGDYAAMSIETYAAFHQFDFYIDSNVMMTERPVSWHRIRLIPELFAKGYEFVLWLDADAIFSRYDIDVTTVILPEKHIYMVEHDINNCKIPNTGVMLLRNCTFSRDLLRRIWDLDQYISHPWWENAAMIHLLGRHDLLGGGLVAEAREITDYIEWLPTAWNSKPTHNPASHPIISHFAGRTRDDRIKEVPCEALRGYMRAAIAFNDRFKGLAAMRERAVRSTCIREPISRTEIDLAYRAVLGRNVENDTVYGAWNKIVSGFPALIESLAASPEAMSRNVPSSIYADPGQAAQQRILAILRKLKVFDVDGKIKARLGRNNDGGYIMLEAFENVTIAYSLGISDDVSWDMDVANRGIDVFQYDHTISALPDGHERFHWSKIGIEGKKSAAAYLDTLAGIIERNTHQEERDLILKCDIEGSEWQMLAEADLSTLIQFKQIVVEVHFLGDLNDTDYVSMLDRAISRLTSNHRVVHVHGNNCAPYLVFGGIPLPSVIELTLFRVEPGVLFQDSSYTFPTDIDMPCSPALVDLQLGAFRF